MAIRDHFRLDVLSRQAAKLQQVDAELAEVERMLTLGQAGAAGPAAAAAPSTRRAPPSAGNAASS
jgi:hypothetical protein